MEIENLIDIKKYLEVGIAITISALLILIHKLRRSFKRHTKSHTERLIDDLVMPWAERYKLISELLAYSISPYEKKYLASVAMQNNFLKFPKLSNNSIYLEKVYIPLKLVPIIDQIDSKLLNFTDQKRANTIWHFLSQSNQMKKYGAIVVVAPPGAGKSTLLQYLALILSQKGNHNYPPKGPFLIPVLIRLISIWKSFIKGQPNIIEIIYSTLKDKKSAPSLGWFEHQLKRKRLLIMFDGLDEVPDSKIQKRISYWLKGILESKILNNAIVTSRPDGYFRPLSQEAIIVTLEPVNNIHILEFIKNLYKIEVFPPDEFENNLHNPEIEKKVKDLQQRINTTPFLREMVTNPFMLTSVATLHYFDAIYPHTLYEFYSSVCDVLMNETGLYENLIILPSSKKKILQALALEMMISEQRSFKFKKGIDWIKGRLGVEKIQLSPKDFLKHVVKENHLLVIGKENNEIVYEFFHPSFQELLAAFQIKDTNQIELLCDNFSKQWWRATVLFYSIQSDATKLIETALEINSVAALRLAFECHELAQEVDAKVSKQLDNHILEGLKSSDIDTFNLAGELTATRQLQSLRKLQRSPNMSSPTLIINESIFQWYCNEIKSKDKKLPSKTKNITFLKNITINSAVEIKSSLLSEFVQWFDKKFGNDEINYRLPLLGEYLYTNFTERPFWAINKQEEIFLSQVVDNTVQVYDEELYDSFDVGKVLLVEQMNGKKMSIID